MKNIDPIGESQQKNKREEEFKWSFFVKLFHWTLVFLILSNLFLTDPEEDLHENFGELTALLILLRLIYGVLPIARQHEKIKSLSTNYGKIKQHLIDLCKRNPHKEDGHNPLGKIGVIVLILSVLGTSISGYLIDYSLKFNLDFEDIHEVFSSLLQFVIAAHIISVFLTNYLLKQHLLDRMLPNCLMNKIRSSKNKILVKLTEKNWI